MNSILEFLKQFLPIQIAVIAAVFIYLLWLFKGLAERFVSIAEKQTKLAETQAQYIQQRLDVVEKYLGISEKAIDLRDSHIKKLEELAVQREEEIVQAQTALTDAKEQLRIQVATLDLREQQVKDLQQLLDTVERASRAEIITRTIHELRTRLQAVIALAENLTLEAEAATSEPLLNLSNEVLYSALALDTVVMNLGQDMTEYHFKKEDIGKLLSDAKHVFQAEAKRRNIDIVIELELLEGKPPVLEVSRYHLQFALNNLLHNAIKYSFHGSPGKARRVRILGKPTPGGYTCIFENFGVGILPEEVRSGAIFSDGYQGKLTMAEYRTGSGKGLFLVRRVIEDHHGRVRVESRPTTDVENPLGQPHLTRFIVYLPFEQPR